MESAVTHFIQSALAPPHTRGENVSSMKHSSTIAPETSDVSQVGSVRKKVARRAKASINSVLRDSMKAGWPALEWTSSLVQRLSSGPTKVRWSSVWDRDLDEALNTLPTIGGCPRDLYRELVKGDSPLKRHALVSEDSIPIAIISLRRRNRYWEPVTYQCIPRAIAPAADHSALGRALNALGLEVHVGAGIGDEIDELKPSQSFSYEWYKINLRENFEAHWHSKRRMRTINRARSRCAAMERRIDGDGDLEWILEQWREQWRDDPGQEIVATEDRLRFWRAMMAAHDRTPLKVHTFMLHEGTTRIAGLVFTSLGDTAMIQCGGRNMEFDESYTFAATILGVIEWAVANGFETLDMAGGDWKRYWGPVGGVRHGAIFRPPLINALAWVS